MPARLDSPHRFEDLGLLGYHPATSPTAAHVMESARVHLTAYADPEAVVRQIKVRIDAGQAIDIRVIGALEGKPELLARAGLTPEALRRQALLSLNHAGGGGTGGNDALLHHLTIARTDLAAASPADPGALELRDQALEIADRNLARMRGERTDTFGRHPDYAEVGRFVSIADLLDALKPNASTAHATSHTASTAAETLTW